MFDIEWDMSMVIVAVLTIAGWVGMFLLFSFWGTKDFDPGLTIKIVCYAAMPFATFFICNATANQ